MKANLLMNFSVDKEKKKINVEREFEAPLETVWAAWTQHELQDQWWAPKPWKANTKSQDFKAGGHWLYAMEGPDGAKQWSKSDYISVVPMKSYSAKDAFCDENGNITNELPGSLWTVQFKPAGEFTHVSIELKFDTLKDLEKIIATGFKEGFTMGMENLDALLESKK
ncbi:MAG: Activator of Hsp90 ATPase 1 family protein [Chitinophagaceae bacterium]|nr:Activator of Hsp90 ATPase 1 family protein [Chitinophagaceae bacterium]